MREILGAEELANKLKTTQDAPLPSPPPRKYIRPLSLAADDLVEQIRNVDGRYMFGILELDVMIRGIGPGEMCIIHGKPHQGKTQVLLNSVVANPQARIVWVTPDEVAELVLLKLVSMSEKVEASDLEDRLQTGDETAVQLIQSVANERFPNLVVVDRTVDAVQIGVAISEATDHWQAPPDLVVYDYLGLMPSESEGYNATIANAQALKALAKEHMVPMVVVHQSSRSGGKRGQAAGIEGMSQGGEAEATYVVEVFRKMDDERLNEYDREQQQNMVTLNVSKNKRPPCNKGMCDLFLHPSFGFVREVQVGDVGTPQEHANVVPSFKRADRVSFDRAPAQSQAEAFEAARKRLETEAPKVTGPSGLEFEPDSF